MPFCLVPTPFLETILNAAEAFAAVMTLLAVSDNNLCRLLSPIQAAIEHVADAE